MTDEKRTDKHCDGHQVLEFKSNLNLLIQGSQLFGIVIIATMVAWSLLKSIPEMEERLAAKITPIIERVAKLEQRLENVEARVK